MEILLLLGALIILLAVGVPVAFALLGSAMMIFFVLDIPMLSRSREWRQA